MFGYQYQNIFFSQNGSIRGFVGINQYIISSVIPLPIGIYLVNAYCLYTLTATNPYYTTLSINTVQSKITPIYNYSRQYCTHIINLNQYFYYLFYLKKIQVQTIIFISYWYKYLYRIN